MKSEELLQKLKAFKKDYYTAKDISKIAGVSDSSILVVLSRLVRAGKLKRIMRNYYVVPGEKINIDSIAQQLAPQSYISFESALSRYGALSQVPYSLTLATGQRSKRIELDGQEVVFRKIAPKFFKGYVLKNKIKIATLEKALLDLVYLVSRGQSDFNFDELNFSIFDRKKLKKAAKDYPGYTQGLLEDLINE